MLALIRLNCALKIISSATGARIKGPRTSIILGIAFVSGTDGPGPGINPVPVNKPLKTPEMIPATRQINVNRSKSTAGFSGLSGILTNRGWFR